MLLLLTAVLILTIGAAGGALVQRSIGVGNLLREVGVAYPTRTPPPPTPIPAPALSADNIAKIHQGSLALFILAGQSNMSGVGPVPANAPGPSSQIYLFGNDYRWRIAEEPLDAPTNQVDEVSLDRFAGYGSGLAFANALLADNPDLVIGLIPCAKWSSTISEWRRDLSDNALYGSCIKRAQAASTMGDLAGILFFQGESDTVDPARFPKFDPQPDQWASLFAELVADFRTDLGQPDLPVVFAQIGTYQSPDTVPHWTTVQEQQASISLPMVAMITTDDLALQDEVHFTADSYTIIGARFAEAYQKLWAGEAP